MAKYPNILKKLIQEIEKFKVLNYEDLSSLEYTTAFIKECLRVYPPAASSIPRMTLKNTTIGDTQICVDTTIVCLPIVSQMNDEYF